MQEPFYIMTNTIMIFSVLRLIAETQQKRVEAEAIITEVDARIGDSFKHSAELHEAQARQAHVLADLAAMANEQNPRTETPNDSVPGGTDDQTATRDRVKKLAERARARADGEGRDEDRDHSLDIRPGRPRV